VKTQPGIYKRIRVWGKKKGKKEIVALLAWRWEAIAQISSKALKES
jgi:hypothetical protein